MRSSADIAADAKRTGRPPSHGQYNTPTYRSWKAMLDRVRGHSQGRHAAVYAEVTVCLPWLRFEAFLEDMGHRPAGHTLDRRDNRFGYSKDNCRWATVEAQNQNRRCCK